MALMTAIAVICTFIHFPLLLAAPWMEYELSSIPILIAAFVFGPVRGLVIAVASILIRALLTGPPSGIHGLIMNIVAAAVLVLVAAAVYQKMKTRKGGLLALIIGGLCATAAMIPANLIVTPLFLVASVEVVQEMLLPIIIPFNLIKAAINTYIVFLLYKRLSPFLHEIVSVQKQTVPELFKKIKSGSKIVLVLGIIGCLFSLISFGLTSAGGDNYFIFLFCLVGGIEYIIFACIPLLFKTHKDTGAAIRIIGFVFIIIYIATCIYFMFASFVLYLNLAIVIGIPIAVSQGMNLISTGKQLSEQKE